jgi:hypothetical protein
LSDGTIRCSIGLTAEEVLQANLAALGVGNSGIVTDARPVADRVLDAYKAYISETGKVPNCREVASRVGISGGRIATVCNQLVEAGRMLKATNSATGKTVFLPKVTNG